MPRSFEDYNKSFEGKRVLTAKILNGDQPLHKLQSPSSCSRSRNPIRKKKSAASVACTPEKPAKRYKNYNRIVQGSRRRSLHKVPHLEYEVLKLIRIMHRHALECKGLKRNFQKDKYLLINRYLNSF